MSGLFYKITYSCEKVREFMYDYLEDSLPTMVSVRFHLHLNGCAECREYLYLYKKAANAKDFRQQNPPPQEFLDSTLEFLRKQGIISPEDDQEPKTPT
jgi:predicted anti-sigma-YlaC factor YlaD